MKLFGVTTAQFLKIGLIAVLFILLLKFTASKVNIPGFSSIAGMV